MSLDLLAAGVVLVGLIAYAMFGGADFGGGVWTALASGPRARQQRDAIFRAMGPVWETNHVWLILIVVTLFTAFPSAFADLFTALFVPLVIILVGIAFRGAAFAFRHYGEITSLRLPATGAVFAIASVITPLAMGLALGAVAGGHIELRDGEVVSGLYKPWLHPFSLACGAIAVAMCAFLTASYMTTRTEGALQEDFRNRALTSSLALGAITALALPIAWWDAPDFWDRVQRPLPIVVMSLAVVIGVCSLAVLWRRIYALAPPVAAGTVAMVLAAWGAVQYPYLLLPDVKIEDAAAGHETLLFFLVALPIGAVILIPSLALLYITFGEPTGGVEGDVLEP